MSLIIEGRPVFLGFKPDDWRFEMQSGIVTWRFTEAQWHYHIAEVARVNKQYQEHHRIRRLQSLDDSDETNTVPLHEQLRIRLERLQRRG